MNSVSNVPLEQPADGAVTGKSYGGVLQNIHEKLKPKTYFEIGTLAGATLALSRCASIAVDPRFRVQSDVVASKPSCQFFQMTSDEFFQKYSPSSLFGAPIDFSFLDGMHLFEFLLRDFINTEQHCRANSIIALHDCLPSDGYMASRSRSPRDPDRSKSIHPSWWTGDVWKLVPVLMKYRPDLQLCVLDATPTGLVLITNLDPSNDILHRNYSKIVAEYRHVTLLNYGIKNLFAEANVMQTSQLDTFEDLSKYFWL